MADVGDAVTWTEHGFARAGKLWAEHDGGWWVVVDDEHAAGPGELRKAAGSPPVVVPGELYGPDGQRIQVPM